MFYLVGTRMETNVIPLGAGISKKTFYVFFLLLMDHSYPNSTGWDHVNSFLRLLDEKAHSEC